jgi:SPP1 family predicted phage head-tail adaptor
MLRKIVTAGRYRHRISIYNPATGRDSSGARIGTGSLVANLWAEKQDWTGSESSRDNGKETAVLLTKFLIRWRTGILPKMQVVHNTVTYDIEKVLDYDGTKRELILECRRVM